MTHDYPLDDFTNSPTHGPSLLANRYSPTEHRRHNGNDNLWVYVCDYGERDEYYEPAEGEIIEQFTHSEETLISYLAGWVARKSAICSQCRVTLTTTEHEHSYFCRSIDVFASMKRYSDSSSVGLITPCQELFNVVHFMEQQFRMLFKQYVHKPNIAESLYNAIYPHCDFSFVFMHHPEHALFLAEKLTRMFVTMRIFYAVKFINHDLNPTSTKEMSGSVRRSEKGRKMQKILHV
jgi:hypothetical protein